MACEDTQQDTEELQVAEKATSTPEVDTSQSTSYDNEHDDYTQDDVDEIIQIAEGVGDLIRSIGGDMPIDEVVDYQELDKFLPQKVDGLPRTKSGGWTNHIGLELSGVEAVYSDEFREVTISLADLAPYKTLADLAFMEWVDGTIDRESDRGFERTRPFRSRQDSWPSYERYHVENDYPSCAIKVWVAQRFFVNIEGEGVHIEICKEARSDISFTRLARIAAEHSGQH